MFKMAELQTLLQLGAVAFPEVVERRLRLVELTQESEGEREGFINSFLAQLARRLTEQILFFLYLCTVARFSSSS